jgi:NADPH-dependent ferric siderophore reductase
MSDTAAPEPRTGDRPRRGGMPHVLEVLRTERISHSLVRVHLGGEGFDAYLEAADPERIGRTDSYAKLLFAKPELGLVPPYDLEELRERLPVDDLPVRRTYTLHRVDAAAKSLAIDFVVHGTEGVAGPWAASAQPGDLLCLSSPGGAFTPAQEAAVSRLYLGDESAVPAIAAAVAALPPGAHGVVLIEVDGADDEVDLGAPAGVDVRWIHRAAGGDVVTEAAALTPADAPVEAFVHGEREQIKALRALLQGTWGLGRTEMSLSAYWAKGRTEDRFQAEKREPIGQLFPVEGA